MSEGRKGGTGLSDKESHDMGTIEAGKRADLIAVERDPLREIRSLRNVQLVVRGGRSFHFAPAR